MNNITTELQEFRKMWGDLLKLSALKNHAEYREKLLIKANKYEKAIADLEAYESNPNHTLGAEVEELRIRHKEAIEVDEKLQNNMNKLNNLFIAHEEAEQKDFK